MSSMVVDSLGVSDVLRRARVYREEFDVNNKEHLLSLDTFLKTGNWGKIQFFAEAPYVTVPETVLRKIATAYIQKMKA